MQLIWVILIIVLLADAAFIAWRFWEKDREEAVVVAAASSRVDVGRNLHHGDALVAPPTLLPAPPAGATGSSQVDGLSGRLAAVGDTATAGRLEIRVLAAANRFGDAWRAVDHALTATGLRNTVREQGHLVFSDPVGRSAHVTLGDPAGSPREILVRAHEALAVTTASSLTSVLVEPTSTSGIWDWK